MVKYTLAPNIEAELDAIWLYIARETGIIDIANRVVDNITNRFWLLAEDPFIGRSRDGDVFPGVRSFPVDNYVILYSVESEESVLILHAVHGSRDLRSLFGPEEAGIRSGGRGFPI